MMPADLQQAIGDHPPLLDDVFRERLARAQGFANKLRRLQRALGGAHLGPPGHAIDAGGRNALVDARRQHLQSGIGVAKAELNLGAFSAKGQAAMGFLQCLFDDAVSIQPTSLADQGPGDLQRCRRVVHGRWALIWRHDRDQHFVQLARN